MSFNLSNALKAAQSELTVRGLLPFGAIFLGERQGPGITLLEAIHGAVGMHSDDSIYAYWEWEALESFMTEIWSLLDNAASDQLGRKTSAIALASEKDCSLDEVLKIISRIKINKEMELPSLTRRPDKNHSLDDFGAKKSKSLIPGTGKLSWACITTIGVFQTMVESGFGDIFSSLADEPRTNRQLLKELDNRVSKHDLVQSNLSSIPNSLILRTLGRAVIEVNRQREKDGETRQSVSEFLVETEQIANWAGLSDHSVLKRLLAIAPETAKAQVSAINKYLGE